MRSASLVLVPLLVACGASSSTRTIHDLRESDFQDQQSTLVAPVPQPTACGDNRCLDVVQGDLIFITASGTLTTRDGVVGPHGSPALGNTLFTFPNRPAFGLFARIGARVMPLGWETVLEIPATGTLELVVNGCDTGGVDAGPEYSCETQGGFNVTVHSKLAAGVQLATTPALSDVTVSSTVNATVNAGGDWQASGMTVTRGQKVLVSASGTFTVADQRFVADGGLQPTGTTTQYDPNGSPTAVTSSRNFALPHRVTYRLHAKVGDAVVELGKESAFLAPADGPLSLRVNHDTAGGATGSIPVSLKAGVVPATGLLQSPPAGYTRQPTVNVPADGVWLSSGLTLSQGEPVFTTATGTLTGRNGGIDAWGVGVKGTHVFPLPNRAQYALHGRIGDQVFLLGADSAVLAPASGALELLVNTPPGCTSGNICGQSGATPGSCVSAYLCEPQGSFSVTLKAP